MGANYSNNYGGQHDYGFPPRKRRTAGTLSAESSTESNHFDKNYLIEGSEFWSERRYRGDCYLKTGKRSGGASEGGGNGQMDIYQKAPTEYIWSNSASYSSSSSSSSSSSFASSSLQKQRSDDFSAHPPPLIARNSLQSIGGRPKSSTTSATNSPYRPPGIQSKYLPSFG